MKTALTELIEELKYISAQYATSNALDRRIKGAYVNALQKAKDLFEKEKQQIKDAYEQGSHDNGEGNNSGYHKSEQYFNQTFLSNESNA